MPVLFEGKHVCEKCHKAFDWVYFETTRSSMRSNYHTVEKIPNEPKARIIETINENTRNVFINCPHCGFDNQFLNKD